MPAFHGRSVKITLTVPLLVRMKMIGKGLKRVSGYGQGDHYITIKIVPPKTLDEKQRALMQVNFERDCKKLKRLIRFRSLLIRPLSAAYIRRKWF